MTELAAKSAAILFTEQKTPTGTIGLIELNNHRALNALNLEMFQAVELKSGSPPRRSFETQKLSRFTFGFSGSVFADSHSSREARSQK